MTTLTKPPEAKVDIRVRAPVEKVFQAFVDPTITTKFWFTRGSRKLEAGKRAHWEWEMYGIGDDVDVKALEPNRRILIEWSHPDTYFVEWRFTPRADGTTQVAITCSGFKGDGDAQIATALDAKSGFSFVLAGLKAWLEHGIALPLVEDKAPDNWTPAWKARTEAAA